MTLAGVDTLHRLVPSHRQPRGLRSWQVTERNAVDTGLVMSGVQHGLPLGVARGRYPSFAVFADVAGTEIDLLPGTPIAVGIVHVATARVKIHRTCPAKFSAAPAGEKFGVEDVAFIGAFGVRSGTE